jgi:hypothetical protein
VGSKADPPVVKIISYRELERRLQDEEREAARRTREQKKFDTPKEMQFSPRWVAGWLAGWLAAGPGWAGAWLGRGAAGAWQLSAAAASSSRRRSPARGGWRDRGWNGVPLCRAPAAVPTALPHHP